MPRLVLAFAFMLASGFAFNLSAQDPEPNLNRYCKAKWPTSQARYSQRYRKWICQIGREEQSAPAIVLNEACASQFGAGSVSYVAGSDPRSREPLVRCRTESAEGKPTSPAADATVPAGARPPEQRQVRVDLAKYCRSEHGVGFFVSKRLTDGHPLCTKQNPAGGSQVHIAVDLTKVCPPGTRFEKVEGDIMFCTSTTVAGSNEPSSGKQEMAREERGGNGDAVPPRRSDTRGRSDAPPDDTARLPDTAASSTDLHGNRRLPAKLEGCGVASGRGLDFFELRALVTDWKKRVWWQIASPCPNLEGGTEISDWDSYCGWYHLGRPEGQRFSHDFENFRGCGTPTNATYRLEFAWNDGKPSCWTSCIRPGFPTRKKPVNPTGNLSADRTCVVNWYRAQGFDFAGLRVVEAGDWKTSDSLIPPSMHSKFPDIAYQYVDRRLTCFYYPPGTFAEWMSSGPQVFFTRADPPYDRIADLVVGELFRVEVVFDQPQDESTQTVTLSTDGGQDTKQFQTDRTQDPKVFRSAPIRLTERASVQP